MTFHRGEVKSPRFFGNSANIAPRIFVYFAYYIFIKNMLQYY